MPDAAPISRPAGDDAAPRRGRWQSLAPYVFAAAVALALFLIWRTLGRYSFDQLVAAVAAIPASRLGGAGLFAAASYVCLTGFDYLALRYAGHPLAYPKAALASFTSLSLGHTIGFAALSSGAVRYRFYSRWGLSAAEVAKVVLFCGITVGLGLAVLAGLALVWRADTASGLLGASPLAARAVGAGCLAVAAAYVAVAALGRGEIRVRGFALSPPPLRLALAQLVVGPLNFACVAACLHQTVSAVAEISYREVASVYVIANVSTLISHVPGGLGVIESVVMYLLPQADLIGALLVFRFAYFLVPLALGAMLFTASELWFRGRPASGRA